jgi:hypothetical protein|tara:strand:+ start:439 stop:588 length:150 start_codon:yes stop_codon:yes gene_type:complete
MDETEKKFLYYRIEALEKENKKLKENNEKFKKKLTTTIKSIKQICQEKK